MPKCPFCDVQNPVEAVTCNECRAELQQPSLQTSPDAGNQAAAPPLPAEADEAFSPDESADPFEVELCGLLAAGRKIEAIRRYRKRWGSELRESKAAVEALARQHGLPVTQAGCGTLGLVLLTTCGGLWSLL